MVETTVFFLFDFDSEVKNLFVWSWGLHRVQEKQISLGEKSGPKRVRKRTSYVFHRVAGITVKFANSAALWLFAFALAQSFLQSMCLLKVQTTLQRLCGLDVTKQAPHLDEKLILLHEDLC